MFLNKAVIIGNLTRDPEVKSLPSGTQVTTFSLATNRVYNDKNGQRQEDTQFHNIVVFGRQAETCGQYLKKGQTALVEGRIQTRSWEDQDGQKKYRTEIVADRVQFGPKAGGGTSSGDNQSRSGEENQDAQSAGGGNQIDYPDEEINPDDIPF